LGPADVPPPGDHHIGRAWQWVRWTGSSSAESDTLAPEHSSLNRSQPPPVASRESLLSCCRGGGGPNYRACSPSERIVPISWDGRNSNWRDAVRLGGMCRQPEMSPTQLCRPIDGNSFVPIVVVICVGSLQPLLKKPDASQWRRDPSDWLVALPRVGGEPGSK